MHKGIIITLLLFAIASLIIGLPSWLVGCREDSKSQCLTSKIQDLTVTNKYKEEHNCTKCTSTCGSAEYSYCCQTSELICANWFVLFSNSTTKNVCKFEKDNDEIYNKYHLNSTYHVIVTDDGKCYLDITFYADLWITGIFFLSLSGALFIVAIILGIWRATKAQRENN